MKNAAKSMVLASLGLGLLLISVSAFSAQSNGQQWKKNHPRRTQVNKRLKNQNRRINQGVKDGQLTKQQAQQLRKEDRQVRQEERDMASQNGGHITKQEQKTLNQQENRVSGQIYQERHSGASNSSSGAGGSPNAGGQSTGQ